MFIISSIRSRSTIAAGFLYRRRRLPAAVVTAAALLLNRVVYTIVHTFAGTYADVAITPQGQIDLIGPRPPALQDLSFVSLEGITYQRANTRPASGIAVNAANWSGTAGFGSTIPAWYKDGSGASISKAPPSRPR